MPAKINFYDENDNELKEFKRRFRKGQQGEFKVYAWNDGEHTAYDVDVDVDINIDIDIDKTLPTHLKPNEGFGMTFRVKGKMAGRIIVSWFDE